MMNKKMICAALAAMMLSGLTACGGDSSKTETSKPAEQSSAAGAASSEESADPASTDTASAASSDAASAASTDAASSAAENGGASEGTTQISFDYVANGVTLEVGKEADGMIEALGQYDKMFEAPSCAFTGTSNYYVYGGLQVVTYPDEHDQSLNLLYEVDLLDNTVATNEGIRIGNTYDDVVAKYGKPDQETAVFAMYKTEGKAVQFFFDKDNPDVISEIVYTVILL